MKTNSFVGYFIVNENKISPRNKVTLTRGDDDEAKVVDINVIVYPYRSAGGFCIVKADFPAYVVRYLKNLCAVNGIDNPLSQEGLEFLGLENKYIGKTRASVIAKYPVLSGYTDETETTLKFPLRDWSFE